MKLVSKSYEAKTDSVEELRAELEVYRRMWYQGKYSISTGASRYRRKLDRKRARMDKRELLREETEKFYDYLSCFEEPEDEVFGLDDDFYDVFDDDFDYDPGDRWPL